MNLWDRLADNKPYPMAPSVEDSDAGDFRFPLTVLCGLAGVVLAVLGFVAGFMRLTDLALWSIAGAGACAVVVWLLPPKPQRRPSK